MDHRVSWYKGKRQPGPRERLGVLEVRGDGIPRAVLADRAEVEGRAHIRLAREAWGPKDSLDTRWWSLVMGPDLKALTVRTGSCGDPLTREDVPRIVRALTDLGLLGEQTMIHVDDGPAVLATRLGGARELPGSAEPAPPAR